MTVSTKTINPVSSSSDDWKAAVRKRMEAEIADAYRRGQEDMRERAVLMCRGRRPQMIEAAIRGLAISR